MSRENPAIASLCHELVKHAPCGLSAEQIADCLGKNYNTLMGELSPLRTTHKFDVDMLVPLMRVVNSATPLDHMARAMGGVYVNLAPSPSAHPLHQQCMASVQSFGDMMVGTAKALDDDIITSEERQELARLGYAAVSDILSLLLQIDKAST